VNLFCATSDDTGNWKYAGLTLSPSVAKGLLTYRAQYEAVKKFDSSLYCLEFFNYLVEYYDGLGGGDVNELAELAFETCEWIHLPEWAAPEIARVAASTLKVTSSGVLWSAHAKHSQDQFETQEISWKDLEIVAAGGDAFKEYACEPT
jgi:hypothetical protein